MTKYHPTKNRNAIARKKLAKIALRLQTHKDAEVIWAGDLIMEVIDNDLQKKPHVGKNVPKKIIDMCFKMRTSGAAHIDIQQAAGIDKATLDAVLEGSHGVPTHFFMGEANGT